MTILYVSRLNPYNIKSWSGLNYYILKCLKKTGIPVEVLGPINSPYRLFLIGVRVLFKVFNIKYDSERNIVLSEYYASQIHNKIKDKKYKLIITSDTFLVSKLNTNIPIYIWTDMLFNTWYSSYFKNEKIHPRSLYEANILELEAIKKSKKIILTSKWAVKEAIKFYKSDSKKFEVVRFGSNINFDLKKNSILKSILRKAKIKKLRLLSVGVDWDRKDMNRCIEISKILIKLGIPTKLVIVGSNEKNYKFQSKNVEIFKFLNKSIPSQREKLKKLFLKSHFFLLMSKAEGCGVVLAEANNFGIPNITLSIGGISEMINNQINGFAFKSSTDNNVIAKYIKDIFLDKKIYISLSLKSFNFYKQYLTWGMHAKKLIHILKR